MTLFYIHSPTQYLHFTTTLLNFNKQQIMNIYSIHVNVN